MAIDPEFQTEAERFGDLLDRQHIERAVLGLRMRKKKDDCG